MLDYQFSYVSYGTDVVTMAPIDNVTRILCRSDFIQAIGKILSKFTVPTEKPNNDSVNQWTVNRRDN